MAPKIFIESLPNERVRGNASELFLRAVLFEISDHIRLILRLWEADKDHLGARDRLARSGEEPREILVVPDQTGRLQRRRVIETGDHPRLAPGDAAQIGAKAILAGRVDAVARGA